MSRIDEERHFWDKFAKKYDRFMERVARDYPAIIERIAKEIRPGDRVLEVACGTGVISLELAGHAGRIEGTDISEPMLAEARRKAGERGLSNIEFTQGDACALNFPDESFDLVVCANALHIMQLPQEALREIHRVLKPGGKLIAPTYLHGQTLRSHVVSRFMSLFGFKAYHRFNKESLLVLFNDAGFGGAAIDIYPAAIPLAYLAASR
ncbi:MAG TPA: methyltransferase domain-containing protein [bacterium]|nr:methyltransferase domain-containing protein [bacterium]